MEQEDESEYTQLFDTILSAKQVERSQSDNVYKERGGGGGGPKLRGRNRRISMEEEEGMYSCDGDFMEPPMMEMSYGAN